MKHMFALALTTLIPLGTLHGAQADSTQVPTVADSTMANAGGSKSDGPAVAAELNTRYVGNLGACANNKPDYFCTGVMVRGTQNGAFDPWNPSSTQLRKGSVSFSILHKIAELGSLYRNSGYALLSQYQAIEQGKYPPQYLCSYVYDAHTDIVGRPDSGCGLQTPANQRLINALIKKPELETLLRNDEALLEQVKYGVASRMQVDSKALEKINNDQELVAMLRQNAKDTSNQGSARMSGDLSSCAKIPMDELGVGMTAAHRMGWQEYAWRLTHPSQQCSLSTLDQAQFKTSIDAHGLGPTRIKSDWNEVLVKVWPQDIPEQLPLAAFFYNKPAGLAEAKIYQQKYKDRTGGWLPVLKLTLQWGSGNLTPFTYSAADQAIQP